MIFDSLNTLQEWMKEFDANKQTQHIKPVKFNKPTKVNNFKPVAFNRKVLKHNKLYVSK